MKKEVSAKREMLSGLISGRKAWTLDEDGDDEEEGGPSIEIKHDASGKMFAERPKKKESSPEPDEEDPLDAFMRGVQAEVRKVNSSGECSAVKRLISSKGN